MGRRGCRQSGAGGCRGGHSLSREGADADPWRSRQPQADGERLQADDEGPWHRHLLAVDEERPGGSHIPIARTSELHGHPVVHDHTFLGSGKETGAWCATRFDERGSRTRASERTRAEYPLYDPGTRCPRLPADRLAPMRRAIGAGEGGRNDPVAPPSVSVAVRDLDLDRLGFRNLRERDVKHTVLVRGLDRGMAYIARKPEGPMNSAVMAFCAMNTRLLVLTPGGLVALGVYHGRLDLDLHVKRAAFQTGQVDAEAVPITIFDHIDGR